MTDGTTGIQVAPTEAEMTQVQDILRRAINSIVGMSQLQADVDMLRQTVQTLQADTERLRQQNAGLDEALFQSRNARNDLTARLSQAENERDDYRNRFVHLNNDLEDVQRENEAITHRLREAEQSRDNAELRVMELEDSLKAAETKLAAIREGYASIFGATPEVKAPEPMPESVSAPPTPAQPEPDTRSDWAPGYLWDYERRAYVKQAPEPEPDTSNEPMPF